MKGRGEYLGDEERVDLPSVAVSNKSLVTPHQRTMSTMSAMERKYISLSPVQDIEMLKL